MRCSRCQIDKPLDDFYANNAWCRECYRSWHRERYTPKGGATDAPRPCRHCGLLYQPKSRRASVYCSRTCKGKARNARIAAETVAAKAAHPPRPCVHCGALIGPERRRDAKFCSALCNDRAHRLQRKLRARGGSQNTLGMVRFEVARRDGFRCGLCGYELDLAVEWPDQRFASLDHVVPVSAGGSSERSNLRLACLTCNVRRRDQITEEGAFSVH